MGDGFINSPLGIQQGPFNPASGSFGGDFGGMGELGHQLNNLVPDLTGQGVSSNMLDNSPYMGPAGMSSDLINGGDPVKAWNYTNEMLNMPTTAGQPDQISATADLIMREHFSSINPEFNNLDPLAQRSSINSALEPHIEAIKAGAMSPLSQNDFDEAVLGSFFERNDYFDGLDNSKFDTEKYSESMLRHLQQTMPTQEDIASTQYTPQEAAKIVLPSMEQMRMQQASKVVLPSMEQMRMQQAAKIDLPRVEDIRTKGIENDKPVTGRATTFENLVKGSRMSSGFGNRTHPILKTVKMHKGIDLAAPRGTAVSAFDSGTVLRAGKAGSFGNLVEIDHGNGLVTRYAHLDSIPKEITKGLQVTAGTTIGALGSTGRSTGPHLHFETLQNGKRINPTTFFKKLK